MAMSRVSLCEALAAHTLVSTPFVVQVGAVVCSHSPHWWVWAEAVVSVSVEQAAKVNPITTTSAVNPKSLIVFFILHWRNRSWEKIPFYGHD
jgi:hypothetical protein